MLVMLYDSDTFHNLLMILESVKALVIGIMVLNVRAYLLTAMSSNSSLNLSSLLVAVLLILFRLQPSCRVCPD